MTLNFHYFGFELSVPVREIHPLHQPDLQQNREIQQDLSVHLPDLPLIVCFRFSDDFVDSLANDDLLVPLLVNLHILHLVICLLPLNDGDGPFH